MKRIWKAKDENGLDVIYVEKCDNFAKEEQKKSIRI